jgi:hypothetical protein
MVNQHKKVISSSVVIKEMKLKQGNTTAHPPE